MSDLEDIVPGLLIDIERNFNKIVNESEKINALNELLTTGNATYKEANEYAIEIGQALADTFSKFITTDILPDGRMYFNIGDRILTPTLTKNFDLVAEFTRLVQEDLNKQLGIGLKATVPKLEIDKIRGFINRLDNELNFEEVKWVLEEPVINFTHQTVNEVLKHNAEFQNNSGLRPRIRRTLVGGACDWCVNLAGTYNYPDDVPDDVYRRHERCRCTTEYIPGDGVKSQNVWNKDW